MLSTPRGPDPSPDAAPDDARFVGATDVPARFVLRSAIDRVTWSVASAASGAAVELEVVGRHVGSGAPCAVEVAEMTGRVVWRAEETMAGGRLICKVLLPVLDRACTTLVARVRLSKHGLEATALLTIDPPVEVVRAAWAKAGAAPGEVVSLTLDVQGAPDGSAASIQVYRRGPEGIDEAVGEPLAAVLSGPRAQAAWPVPATDVGRSSEPASGSEPTAFYFRARVGASPESAPSGPLHVDPAPPRVPSPSSSP